MAKLKLSSQTLTENDVTSETLFKNRRKLLKSMGFVGAGALLSQPSQSNAFSLFGDDPQFETQPLQYQSNPRYQAEDNKTPESKVTSYNNFYEFGTGKDDPKANAQGLTVNPWTLIVDGEVEKPLKLDYDALFSSFDIEERIYRFRCVEAWSMVIPWLGFPLHKLLNKALPTSKARYVAFETLHRPEEMPGQKSRFVGGGIDYPYLEGLRLDEAMHPLTLMSVGLYGKTLPPQNGAPIRLVVPWKYGFKSIKSVVRIRLTSKQPPNTWNLLQPSEYGFYANVNPKVSHPRWSQATERRLGGGGLLGSKRIETQLFNGYSDVASLYKNLDLVRNF